MPTLSHRITQLTASPIREILAVIQRPGMISFAGGLPSDQSFPGFDCTRLPPSLWQYGASEGEAALRELLCRELQALDLPCSAEQVLILHGSQQGIDLVAKLMIDQGTGIAVENPTYLAALQAFRFFGARFNTLDRAEPQAALARSTLCYLVPTFQNPTGQCFTLAERQAIAEACEATGCVLFEDDPYRELVYDACERRPIAAFLRKGSFVYQGSFSKTLAPGLRLGYLVASPDLVPALTRLKQAADLHSNRLSQYLVLQALQSPQREQRTQALQALYRNKRDLFESALRKHLSPLATWATPKGGLFFWLQLQARLDTAALLQAALAEGVAFMPGASFFHDDSPRASHIRLNFSHATEEEMDRGLKILRDLCERQAGD